MSAGAAVEVSPTRRDVLILEGLSCASCAASVEAVLARSPGVLRTSVNFAADAAVVEWRPAVTHLDELIARVRRLGYVARRAGTSGGVENPAHRLERDYTLRLTVAVFFGMWAMLPAFGQYLGVSDDPGVMRGLSFAAGLLSLPVISYSGLPFFRMGWKTLRAGVPGIDVLITLGVIASVLLSLVALVTGGTHAYFEVAVALIALQLLARLLDSRVRGRAQDAVRELLELTPTEASVLDPSGAEVRVSLKAIARGSTVRLRPGERIAVDGVIHSGTAHLDRSLLTGESAPVRVSTGDEVHAGECVLDGSIVVEVRSAAGGRRVDQLALQVRQLLASKPAWQRWVDRFARRFLWLAGLAAALGAVLAVTSGATPMQAAVRALAVFVIACPCALSLAMPLAARFASSAAARDGILLRDPNVVTLRPPSLVYLDKTGTVTEGRPRVVAVHPAAGETREGVLSAAALAGQASEHPIARAITEAAHAVATPGELTAYPGRGLRWSDGERTILLGNEAWLGEHGIELPTLPEHGLTRTWIALDGRALGAICLDDALRPGAAPAITRLRAMGIAIAILSGDAPAPVQRTAAVLGVGARARMTPEDKQRVVESARARGETTAFVGDGLNDGPALAAADLGVAVGGASDHARSAAAVVLTRGGIERLPDLLVLLSRSRRVIRQNLAGALAFNALAVPAAMAGLVHPALAAAAMGLSSLTILLNSARLYSTPRTCAARQARAGNSSP